MPKLGRIRNCPPGRVKLRVLEKDRERESDRVCEPHLQRYADKSKRRHVSPIVIPEMARETNRPMLRTRTIEGVPIHAGSLDPHRRCQTYALGREQVEPTP
ncbi:hypothetical protein GW17_00043319 [Ensete ventricosum]|nr:hypothetical protein GW17_00043319 [Ensete ventricosum]